ncbi:hypothetical protein ACFSTI_04295 [Rhizorhabdus histidinilytica]
MDQPARPTAYVNGRIYTVDAARPWAEAILVEDGRIAGSAFRPTSWPRRVMGAPSWIWAAAWSCPVSTMRMAISCSRG